MAPLSRVKHSTTEPLHSLQVGLSKYYKDTQTTQRHTKTRKDTQRHAKTRKDTQRSAKTGETAKMGQRHLHCAKTLNTQ